MSLPAYADRIGNGGGFYACMAQPNSCVDIANPNHCGDMSPYILNAHLIDLWEITNRHKAIADIGLETNLTALITAKRKWFETTFPKLATKPLRDAFEYTWSHWTSNDKLEHVPDEMDKDGRLIVQSLPDPSACNGKWMRFQGANFTQNDQSVNYERWIWESPKIPLIDKVALYFHESIYFWLRTVYHDDTSARTRLIVGYLFSTLDPKEMNAEILKVLKNPSPKAGKVEAAPAAAVGTATVTGDPPPAQRVCWLAYIPKWTIGTYFKNALYESYKRNQDVGPSSFYVARGSNGDDLHEQLRQQCQNEQGKNDVMCMTNQITCGEATSNPPQKWFCTVTYQDFAGTGNSTSDAIAHALAESPDPFPGLRRDALIHFKPGCTVLSK